MKSKLTYLAILLLLLTGTVSRAQVTGVTYKIVYNSTTCLYDVIMTIASGSTGSANDQEAYTASVNIVVPTGTAVGTSTLVANEPKTGSLVGSTLTRTTATGWSNTVTAVNRTNLTGYDVYHFTPGLSNAYYPAMTTNDNILLFSISIPTTACGTGVRLWNNNKIHGVTQAGGDPTSINFGGDDFNNGMDIGSPTQLFDGNGVSSVAKPNPTVTASAVLTPPPTCGATVTAVATPGACATATLTYAWTGPVTYSTAVWAQSPRVPGTYNLLVTNSNGCTATASVTLTACSLPLQLLSFDATANKCDANLHWEVSNAEQFQHIDVQYSSDGSKYATVGEVSASSGRNGVYSYSYTQGGGKGFYRLKMVDIAGEESYSKTVSVNTDCKSQVVTISPNPTTGIIHINGVTAGNEIKVIDMIGQVVSRTISTGDVETVDLSRYAAGVYGVFVTNGSTAIKMGQVVRQ